jgi:hypothetical protein
MRALGSLTIAALTTFCLPAWALNNAVFVSQNVPAQALPGAQINVDVTMQNTGDTTWTIAGGYFLGSQTPMDNTVWGTNRMTLDQSASIAPGANATFHAVLTAPSQPGDYGFQWQVLQDAIEWFGAMTPNLTIHVAPPPPMSCDGTEKICLSLTDLAAVQATGATVGGDVNSDGFQPVDQGGLDWHFGPDVGLCAGRMEVDVKGLLPQTDSSQPEQVSVFELCGEGAEGIQVLGLQRMMLNYHGNNIFRYYETTDFNAFGWQLGVWTDGFEATGWTSDQTHHFTASWAAGDQASLALNIDGTDWAANGTTQFGPQNKIFTLGARCTHYPTQHAVARFKNFKLWVQGCAAVPDAGPGDASIDSPVDAPVVPDAGQGGSAGSGGAQAGGSGGSYVDAGKGGAGATAHGVDPTMGADDSGCGCRAGGRSAGRRAAPVAVLGWVLLLLLRRRRPSCSLPSIGRSIRTTKRFVRFAGSTFAGTLDSPVPGSGGRKRCKRLRPGANPSPRTTRAWR